MVSKGAQNSMRFDLNGCQEKVVTRRNGDLKNVTSLRYGAKINRYLRALVITDLLQCTEQGKLRMMK